MGKTKNYNFGYFILQQKSLKKTVISFLLPACFSACSPFQSRLDQLGSSHDYGDVSIPMNFHFSNGETTHAKKASSELFQQSLNGSVMTTFKVENREFNLAYNKALRWNGCSLDQKAMGGSGNDNNCGIAFLHKAFHENLNLAFFRCVGAAARTAGYPSPAKVFIHHWGTYSNRRIRNGRSLSLHARARAMDIVSFTFFDRNGRGYAVSTHKRHYNGSQAVFYDKFRDCWRNSLPESCAFSQRGEYLGSIGHPMSRLGGDSLHNDHLHLSLPLCAVET